MDTKKVEKLAQWIGECSRIVFFGGAGVSTESGVPDFRSKDGLYNQKDIRFDRFSPEYLLSHSCLVDHPDVFFEFYKQKMDARHLTAVVTQNIDYLHQRAGSKRVYEIHGTTYTNYCSRCGKKYGPDYLYETKERIPHCDCGGVIRPDVTLYEEQLPEDAVRNSIRAIQDADMMIIGGTSLRVYPANSYIHYFHGKHMVVINRESLDLRLDPDQDLEINDPIGQVFRAVADLMGIDLS